MVIGYWCAVCRCVNNQCQFKTYFIIIKSSNDMKSSYGSKFLFIMLLSLSTLLSAQTDSVETFIDNTISLTPTTDPSKKVDGVKGRTLFKMLNNRVKTVEVNGVKNSVVDIPSILTATGNTPYAGKFVRENGSVRITCFIDKQGNKHAFEGGVQTISAGANMQVYSNGAGNYTIEGNDSQILSFNPTTKLLSIQRGGSLALPFANQISLDSLRTQRITDSILFSDSRYSDSIRIGKGLCTFWWIGSLCSV
jgi:hypothetical protein